MYYKSILEVISSTVPFLSPDEEPPSASPAESPMRAAALSAIVALANAQVNVDECSDASDCTTCLDPQHGGGNCGWCAPLSVIYADGTPGPRCADLRDKTHGGGWQCTGKLMTDQCLPGWVCGGDATGFKCVPSALPGDGNPDYNDCQAGCTPRPKFKCTDPTLGQCSACADPTDPDCTDDYTTCSKGCVTESLYSCNTTSGQCNKCDAASPSCVSAAECSASCAVKYKCEYPSNMTAQPTCKVCDDPSAADCKYASGGDCSEDCDWKYQCDLNAPSGPTCSKAKYGIPKLEWCEEQCQQSYTCDEVAQTCNATGTGGAFKNKTECDTNCPAKPSPDVAAELVGIWRGLEIHNGFLRGEWTANITKDHVTMWGPDLKVYMSGGAQHRVVQGAHDGRTGELWVNSSSGTLVGLIKMIYGDANLEPELAYVALAVSESTPATLIANYDTGMTTATDRVFGLFKCKDDANCVFHLPTGITPKLAALASREIEASNGDECNQFSSCNSCIGATVGGNTCGWCTTKVVYNDSSTPTFQCAGSRTGQASGWTCYGVYRTLSCYDYACDPVAQQCKEVDPSSPGVKYPTRGSCEQACGAPSPWKRCPFDGAYRGLQVDLNYPFGEWMANFSASSNFTTASFTFVPTQYSYAGTIECRNVKDPTMLDTKGEFKLALSNGTNLYGIYQDGGDQPETSGLAWAVSNVNMTAPPEDFSSAMPGLNASVFGYTKCASYKKAVCKF